MNIKDIIKESYETAVEKGWQKEGERRPVPELIALMHSELSEALEEHRMGWTAGTVYYSPGTNGNNKPEGVPIELADVVIRIADMCGQYAIDLEQAIRIKLDYNKTRANRHGGKVC